MSKTKNGSFLKYLYKKSKKFGKRKYGVHCGYCGAYGEHRDHIIPSSFFGNKKTFKFAKDNIIKACLECNTLASNKVFEDFMEKKQYIANKVEKRYSKVLNSPEWTDEEINELEYPLKDIISETENFRRYIKIRIENLNSIEIYE